jgi:hypothetical protein
MIHAQYQVTGHCAHVKTRDDAGQWTTVLLPRLAMVPDDTPAETIKHLLSVNLIGQIGGGNPAADTQVDGQDPDGTSTTSPEVAAAEDPERATARAKLPADGSMPHHNSGQPVWVEWLALRGYDYEALKGQEKPDLVELAKNIA